MLRDSALAWGLSLALHALLAFGTLSVVVEVARTGNEPGLIYGDEVRPMFQIGFGTPILSIDIACPLAYEPIPVPPSDAFAEFRESRANNHAGAPRLKGGGGDGFPFFQPRCGFDLIYDGEYDR